MNRPVIVKGLAIGEGAPKICVPIVGKTREEIFKQGAQAACSKADLVEWRADFYEGLFSACQVEEIIKGLLDRIGQIPLLFTIRTSDEGADLHISTEDYVNINQMVSKTGLVDLIDVEFFKKPEQMKELIKGLQENGVKVIASSHDFEKTQTQEVLIDRLQALEYSGGDLVKMAVMPRDFYDVNRFLQVVRQFSKSADQPVIAMAMGELGALSRVLGEIFGSAVTFGVASQASAPGQIPVEPLRDLLFLIHDRDRL